MTTATGEALRTRFRWQRGQDTDPRPLGYEPTSRHLLTHSVSNAQVTINRPSQPSRRISPHRGSCAAFRSQSVHNTARSKCSNRRLRAVTPELGIRINAVPEWWPEVSDPLLTDLTPMHSSPQPTAFNLRRMCCRSLRGLGGAFHEGLTWRGAPNGHPSFFERRIFIRSG